MCHVTQFGPEAQMVDRIREWGKGTAKEAKEKKGLDMQYAESFRRIKLYVPKKEESDTNKEAQLEE
jgi:hypothetical protein